MLPEKKIKICSFCGAIWQTLYNLYFLTCVIELLFELPTRTMAIANGTCVSFCNQPKAQFGYLRRVTPVCRCHHPFCGWRHLATSRESKAHFGLPGYAPGTIMVNVTWMERGFNAGQTHRSMCPSIFNRLRAIARYWSEIATFSYPMHLIPPLGCSHWNSGKSLVIIKLESWGYQAVKTV